jgi:serine/threonine-protein kinase
MVVIRCLQKPPDLRYSSAGELASDLEAFLRDEPVMARSGRFTQVLARVLRETHHAAVLENWGLLWMWHSLVLLVWCLLTEALDWAGVDNRLAYGGLWTIGLGAWAAVFWAMRHRMGPVTFVERQIAHLWGASMIAIAMLYPFEWWLNLKPLTLSPLLGVVSSMVFLVKAAMLSGVFYVQAAVLLGTSVLMAVFPDYAHMIFGIIAGLCFFVPGLKYHRQRQMSLK